MDEERVSPNMFRGKKNRTSARMSRGSGAIARAEPCCCTARAAAEKPGSSAHWRNPKS